MTTQLLTRPVTDTPTILSGKPRYALRATLQRTGDLQLEVWQLPSSSTPQIVQPIRLARLGGRNLALIEHRILRHLAKVRIDLGGLEYQQIHEHPLNEELALILGLLFRLLAPMKNRENMLSCMQGVEGMSREEAAYWLGMAMHRKHPQRVLSALRTLLTDPHNSR